MFRRITILTLALVLIMVFCGCSFVKDVSYSYYEEFEDDENESDKTASKKDEDKENNKEKENDSSFSSSKVDTDADTSSVNSEKGDDFLTNYKITGFKEKNKVLADNIAKYQNAITKLGKTYPNVDYPIYTGKTLDEELIWITEYNNRLNAYCKNLHNLLVKYGRESVKNGVNGDISAAYEWAKTAFNKNDKLIALTYDDAPNSDTESLLNGLKQRNVPACFFIIGKQIKDSNASLIQRMIDEGHIVGNHSMSHVPLYHATNSDKVTPLDPDRDVLELSEILQNKYGYNDFLLRVPGLIYAKSGTGNASNGKYDAKSMSTKNNLVLVDSNTGLKDADGSRPTNDIYDDLMSVKQGSIVLMHVKAPSVEASFKYIDEKSKEGYIFVTVPELLMAYNGHIDLGVAYKSTSTFANLP